jgi:tetratricopeptide (TPR) repeat protein
MERRCQLSLWRWEANSRPGMDLAGPQGLIDRLMNIEAADVVVGVFWKRFGTPTGIAGSGTEHELRRAWAAWQEHGRPEVMVYFRDSAYADMSDEDLEQRRRLREFRKALPEEQMWRKYRNVADFERLLREHLTRYILDRIAEPERAGRRGGAARKVRFNLPGVTGSFAGRENELDDLDVALGAAGRAVITQAIAGLGGVGKSQLAARYVEKHAADYDIVAWIRAEEGGIADLAALAVKLDVSHDKLSPSERARQALDWLSTSEDRWLLVLDNVASPEQLDGLRPRSGDGRVLVTSRDRSLRQFGPVLLVDVLDEDTATAYLVDRACRPGDQRDARALAQALGCLPLALSHAAAFCEHGTSFAEYLALLKDLPAGELFTSHPELSYAQTVASTWKPSLEAASRAAPLAANVLELAAHLGPDAIPKHLFGVLADVDTAHGRHQLSAALNALARFSLANVDVSVSVHRLLQKTVRDDVRGRDEPAAVSLAVTAISKALPDDVSLPGNWPGCEQLLPHALALALALAEVMPAPGDAGPQVNHVLNELCQYLNWAEPGRRGLGIAQATLRFSEHAVDTGHRERLITRSRVAAAYRYAGRTERAIRLFAALLADSERILGGDDPDTLTVRHLLAYSYHDAERTGEAIAMYESVLAARERVCGAEHTDTLMTRNNLAVAYQSAGRTGDAVALFERVLSERQHVLDPTHPSTLTTRHNLADSYRIAARTADAITTFEALVMDREDLLGTEHPQTLVSRRGLAESYAAAGRLDDALVILVPLLVAQEQILGHNHPDTDKTRATLARVRRAADGERGARMSSDPVDRDAEAGETS